MIPETTLKDKSYFQNIIKSKFANSLGIEVFGVECDCVMLILPVDSEKHINALGDVHGGVIMSVADTVMGCACLNLGKKAITMDFNINFIKGVKPPDCLKAVGTIIHNGSRTMVVEAEVYNKTDALVAKARGTFFVVGNE
jgi:acyl-CoA thioesterase